jgi:phosphopantothenoylcysteine decarboxylase / phosphopantothenate---cysteine ligase
MLAGKKILLGITGSIAAYKSILLVRLLVKAGAEVKVMLTPAAKDFVTPLTLGTLSKNKVLSELFNEDEWSNHVALGRWADVMLIAPLSCNTLAKMANGFCDNLLLATYLSATCPVVVAPAMDEDMWHHASIKTNLQKLESFGNKIIPVEKGELASGLFGDGRMAEPEDIVQFLAANYFRGSALQGKQVLVTAGPTYEAIDPVRFIGNHSTGKMGIALAEELFMHGAEVHLVLGPSAESIAYAGIHLHKVKSADEMYAICMQLFPQTDVAIMSAAVADYKPKEMATEKIKKNAETLTFELVKNRDILKSCGAVKKVNQILVGFALETNNERANAMEKLRNKNADMIVLNSLQDAGAGFGHSSNKITIFDAAGTETNFELKSKQAVASDIVETILKKINGK